jgi:hypothetical protein
MEFIVTVPDDAQVVFDLLQFCLKRRIKIEPYNKGQRAGSGKRIRDPQGFNEPSPVRIEILRILKSEAMPLQKSILYTKLPQFSKSAINASLWHNREQGWVVFKKNRYNLTKNGDSELTRLEVKSD